MSWSGDWGRRPDGLTTALRAAVRSPDHVVATYYAVTAMRSIVNTSMRSPTLVVELVEADTHLETCASLR